MMEESEFSKYYKAFENIPTLSPDRERSLLEEVQRGDRQAYDLFIRSNMRLVLYQVLQFVEHSDPRAMDLVSGGTIGLIRAIKKFQLDRGVRFSTYAVWWINHGIRNGLKDFKKERSTIIRNLSVAFERAKKILRLATRCNPTSEEIALFLNWDRHTLRTYLKFADDRAMIAHMKEASSNEDPTAIRPDDEVHQTIGSEEVKKALAKIPPEEEDIIRRYHGIGCKRETYEEIGNFYGMTKEWVRQREAKGLRKLYVLLRRNRITQAIRIDKIENPSGGVPEGLAEDFSPTQRPV